jgi:hypothetical protein
MPTPYDGKIYLVQVKGSFLARKSLGDVSRLIIDTMPNADGVFLQVAQGKEWQSKFDNDAKAVSGSASIAQWVSALDSRGLETHVWGIPHGLSVQEEAARFVEAARVPGVKSLLLDVEHGNAYYRGDAEAATQLMALIRNALGPNFHIGFILDPRPNRPASIYIDPWLPFMDSLHPMIYPKDFGKPVNEALDSAFAFLKNYNKPIVPMLQSYNSTPPGDITAQGNGSFARGAAGLSFFCLGDRHMGAAEFGAVAAIASPVQARTQKAAVANPLPSGGVGRWPDDPRGYTENVYESAPGRPWHDFRDIYGRLARWKLTSPTNDVAVSYAPQLSSAGRYNIEVFIPRDNADSKRADYHVTYYENGKQKERQVKIDQSSKSDEWVSLGVFDLDPRRQNDGVVNITDFSDERPSQPVAFAGVRWVPASAASVEIASEARRLALLGRQGAEPQPTTATTAQPTGQQITNQDVINAFVVAASKFNVKFTDLIATAGLNSIYGDRKAIYSGPAINTLPLPADRRAAVAEALKMPVADLAQAAASASKPAAPAGRAAPAEPSTFMTTPSRTMGEGKVDGRTWGVHGAAGSAAPPRDKWDFWIEEFKEMGIKWYKQCDSTGPSDKTIFDWVMALKGAGLNPVIRYQQGHQFPNRLDSALFEKMKMYVKEGIVWAEIGNEPNLDIEWSGPKEFVSWQNADCIRAVAENWLADSERALQIGARPAFYAMAPVDWGDGRPHPQFSGTKFHERIWQYLGSDGGRRNRAINIFRSGGWLAVHAAVYEFDVDFDPFPDGRGWDQCLRSYEIPMRFIQQNLGLSGGADYVVMSTESGVFTPESRSMDGHKRYKDDAEHGDLVIKMFDYIERANILQAMMPWCVSSHPDIGLANPDFPDDGWYINRGGQRVARAVVGRMKEAKRQRGQ